MTARISKPMRDLLTEMCQSSTGGLWIDIYKHYSRTAHALADRGLAVVTDRYRLQAFYEPTTAGREAVQDA